MRAIVNLRNEPRLRDEFQFAHVVNGTVLIDRRTRWGNPFRIGEDGSRDEVIARYRAYLWRHIQAGEVSLEELAELDGCWLWPAGANPCPVMGTCWRRRRHGRPGSWRNGRVRDASLRFSCKEGIGRCLRPGLSAAISTRCARSDFRSYPYRLRSLRSLRAPLAAAFGGVVAALAGGGFVVFPPDRSGQRAMLRQRGPLAFVPRAPIAVAFGFRVTRRCTMLRMSASMAAPPLAQTAPHRLAHFAPQRPPLNRRSGSDPPGSPASISRSPVHHESRP